MPFTLLKQWITEEKEAGASNPQHAVLATATLNGVPHSRVVAIREITLSELLFFTQKGTQKVNDIIRNPQVSLTFWFELKQREVILNGTALPLLPAEIEHYWNTNPQLAQLRFTAYAPTSMQPIATKHVIEDKKKAIEREYSNKQLPLSPLYCGFRIKPTQFIFYSLRFDELSDVVEYYGQDEQWHRRILSP
ncbi:MULTISPECIES: pyridoxal 5'-phosphate synthase [Legionella]|uniref:Pyridoxamine 5'-phosphate oxidase n=1 Tax=Legionella maceachernii TaxID=466 RepID=A0A0W0VYP4_9GAMM|nr:pyridoxamine 5'-phosphate oxidase family protein [Legionella maceachernii]KTD25117.1 pyridoxamine 5'-phosphate oxidase [Legionella maceachernii]SKA28895.1 Pyridoxamine 5'-phosphate oxidase [Legionella maceachernii]SUP02511.1 Pyridoxine/pyridoxamine 5'-phosphate oxidase [Legionella maceachernii]